MKGRGRARGVLAMLGALLPLLLAAERPPGLGDVRDVRTWSHPDFTRVVVELSRSVPEPEVRSLSATGDAANPDRLYVDLSGIWVGRDYVDGIEIGDGLLRGVRLGQNTQRTTRLVIDLERYERHRLLMLRAPDRIVLDVYRSRARGDRAGDAKPAPGGDGARLAVPLRSVERIVVDPGHGGRDPGAIGIGRVHEKDVNLKLAKRIASELRKEGFDVVLTREDDRYLDLEERTAFAESVGGDLFVSVHSNSSPRVDTRGIEIYYLDDGHERHSLDVAARESGVPRSQLDSLQRTLAKLRIGETGEHSETLARYVHEDVMDGLASDRRTRGIPDLGVKKGPFYVLFLSSMPSILVEAGFLTNHEDAKLLRSDAYLDLFARRVARGLVRYRDELPSRVARVSEVGR